MSDEVSRRLYDAFPPDRKSDFWAGYLYSKYTEHFFNRAIETMGLPKAVWFRGLLLHPGF